MNIFHLIYFVPLINAKYYQGGAAFNALHNNYMIMDFKIRLI